MMPDLGKYAETVLSAYAISLLLLVLLVWLSFRRSRRIKAELETIEKKAKRHG